MLPLRKYELIILVTKNFNENELQTWAFNYAKELRSFRARRISLISRGKQNLAYPVNKQTRGNYIQINFSSKPNNINAFSDDLKMNINISRFAFFNKNKK